VGSRDAQIGTRSSGLAMSVGIAIATAHAMSTPIRIQAIPTLHIAVHDGETLSVQGVLRAVKTDSAATRPTNITTLFLS